jgi:hypothetical protein
VCLALSKRISLKKNPPYQSPFMVHNRATSLPFFYKKKEKGEEKRRKKERVEGFNRRTDFLVTPEHLRTRASFKLRFGSFQSATYAEISTSGSYVAVSAAVRFKQMLPHNLLSQSGLSTVRCRLSCLRRGAFFFFFFFSFRARVEIGWT